MNLETKQAEELEPGDILLDARVGRVTSVTPPKPDARTQYTHVVGELGEVWMSGQEMVAVYADHEPAELFEPGMRSVTFEVGAAWGCEDEEAEFTTTLGDLGLPDSATREEIEQAAHEQHAVPLLENVSTWAVITRIDD